MLVEPPDFIVRDAMIRGSNLGDFFHPCIWNPCNQEQLKRLLLIAEDHSYTFKTTDAPYRHLERIPYGP